VNIGVFYKDQYLRMHWIVVRRVSLEDNKKK
jgi:hypothetical protein